MRATVELPDAIYRRTEETAQARGLSVDKLIADLLERELEEPSPVRALSGETTSKRVSFPLIHSNEPGTLDLSDFDFDDLLA